MLVKRLSDAQTIVRTTSRRYLDAWREREIDVDFMVSPELETANAIAGVVGLPAARQTDVFAEGKVQIVEFDVPSDASADTLIGRPLRRGRASAGLQGGGADPRRAHDRPARRRADPAGRPRRRDRLTRLGARLEPATRARPAQIDDIVIFGAGRMGTTIAGLLVGRGLRVRLVDADRERAREVAEAMPDVRVFHASAFDPSSSSASGSARPPPSTA